MISAVGSGPRTAVLDQTRPGPTTGPGPGPGPGPGKSQQSSPHGGPGPLTLGAEDRTDRTSPM